MDISKFSVSELKSLLEMIPREIKRRQKEDKTRIRKELEALAAKSGYSLDELLVEENIKHRRASKPVIVKYRHPEDKDLAWTGRGRQPKWVIEFLNLGGSLEQLIV